VGVRGLQRKVQSAAQEEPVKTISEQLSQSNIAFSEMAQFQIDDVPFQRNAKWIPPFALDAEKLRLVLRVRGWAAAYGGMKRFNPEIPYAMIDAMATARALRPTNIKSCETSKENNSKHREAVRRAGTYLSLHAAIAFRAWRLGQNSVEVAAEIGLTPVNVRVSLERLKRIARELGFDTGENHHSYTISRRSRRPKYEYVKGEKRPPKRKAK
jgi:hypothetical protein